ncbi:MAG TPA: papain-like cysteine protease family protein [Solirubrobacteraceae bacterium]|jgi:hypothetical protein
MQHQLQTNWCWSACATSTSLFYASASAWTQCKLAGTELNQTTCCQDGSTTWCNQPWYLDRALTQTGNFGHMQQGPLDWNALSVEIDAGRPVAARIGWAGGGGHFVVISGVSDLDGGPAVDIQDPWFGPSTLPLQEFTTRYRATGTWTHSYFTSG